MAIDKTQEPYVINPDLLAQWVAEHLKVSSQNKLAKALNTSSTSIIRWKRGEVSSLYPEHIEAMARIDGSPMSEMLAKLGAQEKRQEFGTNVRPSTDLVHIPVYNMEAGVGSGVSPVIDDVFLTLAFDREWLRSQVGSAADSIKGIIVAGDSMSPGLRDGDVAFIDQSDKILRDGLYFLRIDKDLMVKRVAKIGDLIRLISDNPLYPDFDINLAELDIEVLGRVVLKCQRT